MTNSNWIVDFFKRNAEMTTRDRVVQIHCGNGDNVGSKVVINGVEYIGDNISINGNKVVIDGQTQQSTLVGPISIVVEGDVGSLTTTSGDVTCGNVGMLNTTSGDVDVTGHISGNINTTSGDIRVGGDIHGNINTISGDVIGRNKK
jgi:hypothetical protein